MTSANDAATVKPMSGPTREPRLIDALVTLADTLVADYDLVELMQYLVEVSVDLLDAAAAGWCGVNRPKVSADLIRA
jgi:hypothetical protein